MLSEGLGVCEVETSGYWNQPGIWAGNNKKNGATSTNSMAALSIGPLLLPSGFQFKSMR